MIAAAEFATVHPEVGPRGNRRLRCEACDKVAFPTEALAREAADKIRDSGGPRMRAYKGCMGRKRDGVRCGWWHLTRVVR